MPEQPDNNSEFHNAWDDLRPRLKEPGFNLDSYLAEKAKTLSPETVRELRIAERLRKMYILKAEYEKWKANSETERQNKAFWLNVKVLNTAASIIIVLLVVWYLTGLSKTKAPFQQPGKSILVASTGTAIIQTIFNLGQLYHLDIASDAISNFKRINEGGNFKYGDLDGDGVVEFVFAQSGHVICFDLEGNEKWHFELAPDKLEPDYLDKLLEIAKYSRAYFSLYPGLPENSPARVWLGLPPDPTLEQSWDTIKDNLKITKICDFESLNSGYKDVVLNLFGGVIVLDHKGNQKVFQIDGSPRRSITVLDGFRSDGPNEIADVNGDGKLEFIVYRMSGFPISKDWKSLIPSIYVYDGDVANSRGLYVASLDGKELWHLNMPYHCQRVEVCDWDNDNRNEILIDTHIPNNGYFVKYTPEYRAIVGYNFDWEHLPPDFPSEENDGCSAIVIAGMADGKGQIEYWHRVSQEDPYHFACSRFVNPGPNGRVDSIEYAVKYNGDKQPTSDCWYRPWISNIPHARDFTPLEKVDGGYINLYNMPGACLFGFDTEEGSRRVFGVNPLREIKLTDDMYKVLASYVFHPPATSGLMSEIRSAFRDITEQSGASSSVAGESLVWGPYSNDASVFDVKDFNNDGSKEILVGFGNFPHAGPVLGSPSDSFVQVLSEKLQPFPAGNPWAPYPVKGPVHDARFEDVNNDGRMEIVVISDLVYILTPQ